MMQQRRALFPAMASLGFSPGGYNGGGSGCPFGERACRRKRSARSAWLKSRLVTERTRSKVGRRVGHQIYSWAAGVHFSTFSALIFLRFRCSFFYTFKCSVTFGQALPQLSIDWDDSLARAYFFLQCTPDHQRDSD